MSDVNRIKSDLTFYRYVLENTKRSIELKVPGMQDQADRVESTILALEIKLKEAEDAQKLQNPRKRRLSKPKGRGPRKKAKR